MPAAAQAGGLPSRLGKYELLLPLAAGGMARIYIGRSTGIGQFERHVVLKMITPEKANDATAVNMFLDEARLAASLNHQNVAQVFEVGEEGGIHFLAMEYVHGQDLRSTLAKAGNQGTRIPLDLALTVVAGAASGLNHAHERRGPDGTPLGIVHRDVSPSNIMIGYDGAVKLLDFGIAKATMRSVETQSGIIKGKFAYMAPEQCRGRNVDRRSDVFSLGIILYEITTQHRCFRADNDFDTMHRIVTGDVVRPTRLVQGYPQALEAIVLKALATDPAQRYQSAGLLLEALESFAVTSRMSLSTMGLGRFMRDMFGEVQEPWLNASMKMAAVTPPKEKTVSSTGGASDRPRHLLPTTPNPLAGSGLDDDESDEHDAAKTLLQVPGSGDDPLALGLDDPPQVPRNWNGEYAPPPVLASSSLPTELGLGSPVAPTTLPLGTQPLPMTGESSPALRAGPSRSGPSAPGVGISTKHGYASAATPMSHSEPSYPRYEPPTDTYAGATGDRQQRYNRRPLFIGLGIAVAGVIVMLVVALGGDEPDPIADATQSRVGAGAGSAVSTTVPLEEPPATPVTKQAAPQQGSGSAELADESMVSIVIHSDPSGADVLIAGAKIGTTPFEKRVARGTKVQDLTIHMDGYVDFNGRIDLGGEYENKNIKLVRVEDATGSASDPEPPAEVGVRKPDGKKLDDKPSTKTTDTKATATGRTTGTSTGRTTAPVRNPRPAPKPKCQPPGPNVDPFGLPICKS